MPTLPDFNERDRHIKGIEFGIDEPVEELGDHSTIENEDGSVDIVLDELAVAAAPQFDSNLAEHFDDGDLKHLASELVELIGRDREARKRRDEQYEEGLRRTGLGNDAPGGAGFDGASKVVHPILAESCVDFAARAIKELFPPTGPVRTAIHGIENEAKIELANRKAKYLNWQLTKKMPEYRAELEQLLTQLPMGGSQYQKFYYDSRLGRSKTEFVPIDNMVLPYAANEFYGAQRATHVQHITRQEYNKRVDSGLYRDTTNIIIPPNAPEGTATEEANQKIEGKEADAYNDDGLREIYEVYLFHEFEEDDITEGYCAPYIVTVDKYNEEILAIYRNWEEQDTTFQKLDWIVEWKFIPWRGAYAIGFPHLIGGLSGAATGALRALLDSAHINNSQALVKLKAGKTSGQNIAVEPTQIADIEGPAGVDDIRKVIMPMPYNQPSPVLFQLLGWLTDAGKGVIATAEENMKNIGDRTPVGTTMAMIEQGSQTYSAIHARLHYSQCKALQIICRLNKTFMNDEEQIEDLGGLVISREDFISSNDIEPVTDPLIFSESQRYAQMQGAIQLRSLYNGQQLPNLPFNDVALVRSALRRLRIENIDEILPEPPKPQNLNPAAENVAALKGAPVVALPKQNHLAHIIAHVEFCINPVFANPIMGKMLMGNMLNHIQEHIGLLYADMMAMATRFDESVMQTPTRQLEEIMARVNMQVLAQLQKMLEPLAPKIAQIQQMAQQFTPPPPMDPAVDATFKAAMAEIERKKQRDQQELQMERELRTGVDPALERERMASEMHRNQLDNRTKHVTELAKNIGDNRTKQQIAAMQMGNDMLMNDYQSKLDQDEAIAGRIHEENMTRLDAELHPPEPKEPKSDNSAE